MEGSTHCKKTFYCSNKLIFNKLLIIGLLIALNFALGFPNELWLSWVVFIFGIIVIILSIISLIFSSDNFLKIDENNFEWRPNFWRKRSIPVADVYKAILVYPSDDIRLILLLSGGRRERIESYCFASRYTELVNYLSDMEERIEGFCFDDLTGIEENK